MYFFFQVDETRAQHRAQLASPQVTYDPPQAAPYATIDDDQISIESLSNNDDNNNNFNNNNVIDDHSPTAPPMQHQPEDDHFFPLIDQGYPSPPTEPPPPPPATELEPEVPHVNRHLPSSQPPPPPPPRSPSTHLVTFEADVEAEPSNLRSLPQPPQHGRMDPSRLLVNFEETLN